MLNIRQFASLMLLAPCVCLAADWRPDDTKREFVFMVFQSLDWAQTRSIARNPSRWYERNSTLGSHPSVREVDRHFAATAALNFLIAKTLSPPYRDWFQYSAIAVEFGFVIHNDMIGIEAKF